MHREVEFQRVSDNQGHAKSRLQDAQALYEETMSELRPGEIAPGISEVMIRYSRKQKYRKVKALTPNLKPISTYLFFTNGKSARILLPIVRSENSEEPFLWLTLEKK